MIDDDYAQPLAHGLEDININEASIVGGGHTEDTISRGCAGSCAASNHSAQGATAALANSLHQGSRW